MKPKIVGIGEILWDLLPSGQQLGGAPANFAYHARALGARGGVVARVGRDESGIEIKRRLEELGLPLGLLQEDETAPTGTVAVELSGDGVPHFTIHEGVAWDRLQPSDAALQAARGADAICFGSLAQRSEPSRSTIQGLVDQSRVTALRIFDVNLRQHFFTREILERSLRLANVLKLNDTELPVLADMFDLAGDAAAQLAALAGRFELELVALTRGPQGSLLLQDGRRSEFRPQPVKVMDTVGAGDAFTAALAMGLLRKMDLDEINRAANEVARHVCSCAGATPPLPDSLQELFR